MLEKNYSYWPFLWSLKWFFNEINKVKDNLLKCDLMPKFN